MTPLLARTAHFAALVGSAAIGWAAHDAALPAVAPAVVVAAPVPAAQPKPLLEAPLIAVAGDGNVTLRVEQQPLEWVLEQIALQSGRALPAPAAAAPVAAIPPPAAPMTQALPVVAQAPEPAEPPAPLVDP